MKHELKCESVYYRAIIAGKKPWELRFNDRNFIVGDKLWLRETKDGHYTFADCEVTILFVLKDFPGLCEGFALMTITKPRYYTEPC